MKTTLSSSPDPSRHALILVSAASVLLFAGCGRGSSDDDSGDIIVSGTIEATVAHLAFKIPGRVIERAVDEGDGVEAGALIARLDDVEIGQQLEIRKADFAAAEAALADLEAGSRPQEIASAEAAVRSAEAERDLAKLELDRQQELHATEAAAKRELDNAQAHFSVAQARVQEARERLALVREGPRKNVVAQARARVSQARAALDLAQTQVSNTRLEAPFAGVILEKHVEPGEFVNAGTPIVTLSDTAYVWLRAYVNQTDLGRIHLGQTVEVRTDTFPDKTYHGRLSYISSEAEFTPKTVQTKKERVTLVFRIKVDLENPTGELKPGMPADATIPAADR